ncbi:aromatic amino acid transport family protein [Enterovibrio paralichthyis]|uniref:aromatic amino acid transport family protein n=1 Tax=Enterovibrio paralichthyis TaxID=2853805 RepID=UPI001C491EB4|nr:aromatic amino acid transport family protein [Enterovibrio paralichthyis]MBV7297647.1 aromatic amino acid transporter [Enterovibrio paralichthyis]
MRSKVFGSTLIIAGTTIGAGMLALPLASSGIGFMPSIALMLAMWMLMSYTALLMLEVHQHAPQSATLGSLADQFLGKKGRYLAIAATLFLLYALCAAYIAGGGSQFHSKLASLSLPSLPTQTGTLLFTVLVAGAVMLGTSKVDVINRVLFITKIVLLGLSLMFLLPQGDQVNLLSMPLEKGLLVSAIPVMFTSFGFHGSIPSVVAYTGLNIRALRKIMLIGSALPLIIYVLWQAASFGILGQDQLSENNELGMFLGAIGATVSSQKLTQAISLFADLALATSFLGVSLGLFDFLADLLKRPANAKGRIQTGMITFLPPLVIALYYPQGFVAALGYAAIALVVLAVLLPVLMAHKVRKLGLNRERYQVFGGNITLSIAIISGLVVIVSQLAHGIG